MGNEKVGVWSLKLKSKRKIVAEKLAMDEGVAFFSYSFYALWIEPFRIILFIKLVGNGSKEIHAKEFCIGDEYGSKALEKRQ